ncbi:unnamed protein product [Coregonus sp. 'balchen']|nr:unnamed protein product [Coregonus sp. 'balchen']
MFPSHCLHSLTFTDLTALASYPSGHVAVCQSHSGLPCGGFYTKVFSGHLSLVILARITAVGRGTITHPLSGTVTAMWDQSGGLMCEQDGAVTKEWTWQAGVKEKMRSRVGVSDQISVRLLSGTCAILSFRSQNECPAATVSPAIQHHPN